MIEFEPPRRVEPSKLTTVPATLLHYYLLQYDDEQHRTRFSIFYDTNNGSVCKV